MESNTENQQWTLDERKQKKNAVSLSFLHPPPPTSTPSIKSSLYVAELYPQRHRAVSPNVTSKLTVDPPLCVLPLPTTYYLDHQLKSTGGAFRGVVAAGDGLFVKTLDPTAVNTPSVLSYYLGSKCGYGR